MRTPSAAVLPIPASTASRGPRAVLLALLACPVVLAWPVVLACSVVPDRPALAETRLTLQQGPEADRLLIHSREPVPLLRAVSGRYSVSLAEPAPPLAVWPRGLAAVERRPQGFAFDLAPGVMLTYRVTATGTAIEVLHRQGGPPAAAAATGAAAPPGPLPARQVAVGLVFTAARLAAVRLGPESVLLVVPVGSDLDLAGLPPRAVRSAEELVQGRHRLVRLGLDPGAGLELVREGQGVWRLGFAPPAPPRRLAAAFLEEGRAARLEGLGAGVEAVSLRLPDLGPVGIVLAEEAVGVGKSRSPFLDLFESDVGALVTPRSENVVMVKDGPALVISAVDRVPR